MHASTWWQSVFCATWLQEALRGFTLPWQAEKANGRAAMIGYVLAYFVDSWTGAGLYDQQNSFLGKLALHLVVFAILIFRWGRVVPAGTVYLHHSILALHAHHGAHTALLRG